MVNRLTHLHYIVWGYDRIEATTGNYVDNTIIDVIAGSETAALARAKDLVKKKAYRVNTVVEHFDGQPCSKA